ncbi:MAG TPA: SymE family type I addiction module toxin [Candidatus Acidoferrales bacterium]|nr:SymE family type I addiction module toxin [Candidatus Acidoferrales bacterium]
MRKLRKVQYGHYEDKAAKPHPVIRIAGKYLERFGFNIGDVVEVEIADGRIMVQKLSEPDDNYADADTNPRESGGEKR